MLRIDDEYPSRKINSKTFRKIIFFTCEFDYNILPKIV